jgi:acyl-CoA thioester hydrolase
MQKSLAPYRVIYGDTDQMGVVYYANYLRWFEMGRTELLRQIGATYSSVEEAGFFFPVTEVSCRYLKPARFDDEITVETTLTALGRDTPAWMEKESWPRYRRRWRLL